MKGKLEHLYREEVYGHTSQAAVWIGGLAAVFGLFYIWQDRAIMADQASSLFPFRFLFVAFPSLYIPLYFYVFKKHPQWGYFAYGLVLLGLQCCIVASVFMIFKENAIQIHKFGIVGGLSLVIMGVYVGALGLRKYLWLINTISIFLLLMLLTSFIKLSHNEMAYFSSPVTIMFLTSFLGILDVKMRRQAFMLRKLVEDRRAQLEVEIEHRREAESKLQVLASTDELTGLFNRRGTMQILEKYIAICRRLKKDLTLCFMDLDNLKFVNDVYGHQEGDAMIKNFSKVLTSSSRASDFLGRSHGKEIVEEAGHVGRLGGDEFLIILIGCNKANAKILVDRINGNLEKMSENTKKPYRISFSYGLVENSLQEERSAEELLEEADKTMYLHKKSKK